VGVVLLSESSYTLYSVSELFSNLILFPESSFITMKSPIFSKGAYRASSDASDVVTSNSPPERVEEVTMFTLDLVIVDVIEESKNTSASTTIFTPVVARAIELFVINSCTNSFLAARFCTAKPLVNLNARPVVGTVIVLPTTGNGLTSLLEYGDDGNIFITLLPAPN